jgi:hypothetical protein
LEQLRKNKKERTATLAQYQSSIANIHKTDSPVKTINMKSILSKLLLPMLAMQAYVEPNDSRGDNSLKPEDIDVTPFKVIPKGCKEYWFNKHGGFTTEGSVSVVYYCIASSDKAAKKKFKKFDKNLVD